jgi:hypothetical protein
MEFEHKGAGRRGEEPTPSQASRPERTQAPHQRGEGIRGVPPPQAEPAKPLQGSAERQPRPGVWDVLEREVRLYSPELPPMTAEEYSREIEDLSRLQVEMDERGPVRDNLIRGLYWDTASIISSPPGSSPFDFRHLTLEEFQQFRSQVEALSEEEIRAKTRQVKEERDRQWEEYRKRHKNDPPTIAHHYLSLRRIGTFGHGTPVLTALPSRKGSKYIDT